MPTVIVRECVSQLGSELALYYEDVTAYREQPTLKVLKLGKQD